VKERKEFTPDEKRAFGLEMERRRAQGLVLKGDTYGIREARDAHNEAAESFMDRIVWDGRNQVELWPDEQLIWQLTEGLEVKRLKGYFLVVDPNRRAARPEPTPMAPCAECGSPTTVRRLPDCTGAIAPVCRACADIPQGMREYGK
jgi:hypothetical protein